MRRRRNTIVILLLTLCAVRTAFAQIEKQAQTYDMTLEDCLTWTLKGNPQIQQARLDVERAAGTKLDYRSHALPQFSTEVAGGAREGGLYPPTGPFALLTAHFSQPLIDLSIPPILRRANLEVVVAQQNLHRAVTDRLYDVRVTFIQALYFRDLVALYEEIDNRLQANVQSEQQRIDAGTGNEAALKSAKIQQLNLELDLTNFRATYFSTVTVLAQLCGRDTNMATNGSMQVQLPNPVGTLQYKPAKLDMAQESAYALSHRADLKLLQALADATAADKQAIQAHYFPSVSLIASGLLIPQNILVSKQTSLVPGQDPRTSEVRGGAALTWQVIDNGQITGAAHRLEAVRQEYEITLEKLKQDIPRELATIQSALQSADARHEALLKSVESAEENLHLVEAQVSLGEATQFDFLKAQTNLLSVRAGLATAIQSHEVARAELDRATGRYLQYEDGAPSPRW